MVYSQAFQTRADEASIVLAGRPRAAVGAADSRPTSRVSDGRPKFAAHDASAGVCAEPFCFFGAAAAVRPSILQLACVSTAAAT